MPSFGVIVVFVLQSDRHIQRFNRLYKQDLIEPIHRESSENTPSTLPKAYTLDKIKFQSFCCITKLHNTPSKQVCPTPVNKGYFPFLTKIRL